MAGGVAVVMPKLEAWQGLLWGHLGSLLITFEITLGAFGDHFGSTLGVTLGSPWDSVGVVWGKLLDDLGMTFDTCFAFCLHCVFLWIVLFVLPFLIYFVVCR